MIGLMRQETEDTRGGRGFATAIFKELTTKIVIVGGSGFIGSQLVKVLRDGGLEVVAASPQLGVNAVTGEGLVQSMAGAQVVVDVLNSPTFEDSAVLHFFETSSRNLLAAGSAAGVRHHVALSIVGTERNQGSGYFRGKLAQEALIKSSKTPYTILRATQFFEFISSLAGPGDNGQPVRLSPAMMQPVASSDVVAALADIVLGDPNNQMVELAGPDKFRLADIVAKALAAKGDAREIIVDEQAPYYGVVLNDQSLMPGPNATIGKVHFAQWLSKLASNKQ
jgi:uncharacterized protein YbjT (DUF2867 family)